MGWKLLTLEETASESLAAVSYSQDPPLPWMLFPGAALVGPGLSCSPHPCGIMPLQTLSWLPKGDSGVLAFCGEDPGFALPWLTPTVSNAMALDVLIALGTSFCPLFLCLRGS